MTASKKLRKLAAGADSLAADIESYLAEGMNGYIPLGRGKCWSGFDGPVCAVGHVLKRAGFNSLSHFTMNDSAIQNFLGEDRKDWPLGLGHDLAVANDGVSDLGSDHYRFRNQAVLEPLKKFASKLRTLADEYDSTPR